MAERGRRRGTPQTREEILTAARTAFAEHGYDRASVRGIARAAGVDPALVHHFYGTKEGLFVAAMRFPVEPAALAEAVITGPREQVGERLARTFLTVWEVPELRTPALALFKGALTTEQGAAMLREFVSSALLARVAAGLEVPRLRIAAAAAQLIGIVLLRYVVGLEPVRDASVEELVELLGPTLQRYLEP